MTYAALRATAAAYARRALGWIASVSLTPPPRADTEAEHERKELTRVHHIAELNLWMRRTLWERRKEGRR